VVRQFLAGATEGPIGMSEEADAGRNGPEAVSTSGMTAEETEALEREAGAPDSQGGSAQPHAAGETKAEDDLAIGAESEPDSNEAAARVERAPQASDEREDTKE
jgi:hypothetical protein